MNVREVLRDSFIKFLSFICRFRDIVVLCVFTSTIINFVPDFSTRAGVIFTFLILLCLSLVTRLLENTLIEVEYKEGKRFTFLDSDGNPSLLEEDLPEAIEYLYRIEEENNK